MPTPKPTTTTTAPPVATTAPALSAAATAARRAALEVWSVWAEDLAAGRPMPPVADVLSTGAALEITGAIEALAADAGALVKARALEGRIAGRLQWRAELLQPFGGSFAGLKAELETKRAEVKQLERRVSSLTWDHRLGSLKAELADLKIATPRVFPPAPAKKKRRPAPTAPAAKRERPAAKPKAVEII